MEELDRKDTAILEYLENQARDKISLMSDRLGIPRATIFERMERMKKEGIIKKFTIEPDYEKIGMPVLAYIMINFDPKCSIDQKTLSERLSRFPNVISVAIISGQWDILVLTRNRNMKELSMFVLDKLRSMEGVERTLSLPIFDKIK